MRKISGRSIWAIFILLILLLSVFSYLFIRYNNNRELHMKDLAWSQLTNDVKKNIEGGYTNSKVTQFKVSSKLEGSAPFDYDLYLGKKLYLVTFTITKSGKPQPYLVYINPKTEKVIGTRVGYITLD